MPQKTVQRTNKKCKGKSKAPKSTEARNYDEEARMLDEQAKSLAEDLRRMRLAEDLERKKHSREIRSAVLSQNIQDITGLADMKFEDFRLVKCCAEGLRFIEHKGTSESNKWEIDNFRHFFKDFILNIKEFKEKLDRYVAQGDLERVEELYQIFDLKLFFFKDETKDQCFMYWISMHAFYPNERPVNLVDIKEGLEVKQFAHMVFMRAESGKPIIILTVVRNREIPFNPNESVGASTSFINEFIKKIQYNVLCAQCSKPLVIGKNNTCQGCKNRYCNRECYVKHWKNGHKEACPRDRLKRGLLEGDEPCAAFTPKPAQAPDEELEACMDALCVD